ncbi:MAG: 1-deoxy-D-xylulose-5-phosphate reductoisomerase [Bacteroidales bacterium]|nr:1-deoxy-D-xylulose-5-phosphate reductoisomerase [Bacteroidales bacterium]
MSDKREKKRIAVLGSTGSIGRQTLDVVAQHPDWFEIECLVANTSSALLIEQARRFDPNCVVIGDEGHYEEVRSALQPLGIKVYTGSDAVCDVVRGENIDIVVTAMVGFSGLRPTVAAIESGKVIALANKETLVAAGEIIIPLAVRHRSAILPVDSEHSAIFQSLQGGGEIEKLILTCSGGPFRTWDSARIAGASVEEALKHPRWDMGAKITIDSATLMNKGFEVIEAKWLFGVAPDRIEVVIHPESIIHSMVQFSDGAVIAQLGSPDMRVPIQYALTYPSRIALDTPRLDFGKIASLTFDKPDTDRFPCLKLAFNAMEAGGNIPCAMNAANEVAVAAFLAGRLRFGTISAVISHTMEKCQFVGHPTLEDIFETNDAARRQAAAYIESL